MKIVIVGAGAVGGVLAAFLSHHKYDVELVCKHKEIVEAIANNGLRVEGIKGRLITYPHSVMDISQISSKPDIIFLATKAYDLQDIAHAILPFLKEDTMVVSLQNGICEDQIAAIVGAQRTVGCVVGWGATLLGFGRMELTSDGSFVFGELNNEITHRLLLLRSICEKIFPVQITSNIYGALYSKLIVNSCITTLGAITGLYLGDLLKIRTARNLFLAIFTEAVMVARAAGIKLERVANRLNPYQFALTKKEMQRKFTFSLLKKHLFILIIGYRFRRLKSSSLQSLERGRPTEIDYLNGYIVQKATEFKVAVPINSRLISLVKDIEKGKQKIERENIYKIF